MEFGLFSESGQRRNAVPAEAYDQDIDEIVLAESLGMTEAWIAEPNHVGANTVVNAAMLMCRAGAMTQSIRFGHAIRQLPLHHPVDLVQEANACDQLLKGRFVFGYGGTHLVTHEQLDMRGIHIGHEETRAMVHESVAFMLRCWTEPEPFDFAGRYWSGTGVHVLPPPYQQPHPPIAAGCSGSADSIQLAARNGFIPLLGRGRDPASEIRGMADLYVREAAAAGQPTTRRRFRVTHLIFVGESDREARAAVEDTLGRGARQEAAQLPYLAKHLPPGMDPRDVTLDFMIGSGMYWIGG